MRQAIGTTWIMQLVIIFMLIFVAFLALTINYTKAFKIKNEMLSIVEKYEGLSESEQGSIHIINNYLLYNGYYNTGKCQEGEYGSKDLNSTSLEPVNTKERYYYCVQKIYTSTDGNMKKAKYQLRVFFKFSLPVLGDLFTFQSEGTTIDITNAIDDI